jgi:hypothetical protein
VRQNRSEVMDILLFRTMRPEGINQHEHKEGSAQGWLAAGYKVQCFGWVGRRYFTCVTKKPKVSLKEHVHKYGATPFEWWQCYYISKWNWKSDSRPKSNYAKYFYDMQQRNSLFLNLNHLIDISSTSDNLMCQLPSHHIR